MLGILGWAMFIGNSINQNAVNDEYVNKSYHKAKENGEVYYYDNKGKKYSVETDEQVFFGVEFIDGSKHKVIKTIDGRIIQDLTLEELKKNTKKAKRKSIEIGKPVYCDSSCKKYLSNYIWRDVDNDKLTFMFTSFSFGDYYYEIYREIKYDNNKEEYLEDKHGIYYCTKYRYHEKPEYIKTDWRGYKKFLVGDKSYYDDIDGRKITDKDGVYYVVFSVEDDTPWGMEYKNEDCHRLGIRRFWSLHENNGKFIRETKWYHEGSSLRFGKDVLID